eukprot:1158145-Pelagomonas_calceolata.AAC.6
MDLTPTTDIGPPPYTPLTLHPPHYTPLTLHPPHYTPLTLHPPPYTPLTLGPAVNDSLLRLRVKQTSKNATAHYHWSNFRCCICMYHQHLIKEDTRL